jgi:hypothetical protein
MLNAFKAFEIKNKSAIAGGYVVTWVGKDGNGNTICDIGQVGSDVYCSVPDAGVKLGTAIATD